MLLPLDVLRQKSNYCRKLSALSFFPSNYGKAAISQIFIRIVCVRLFLERSQPLANIRHC